MSGVSRDRESYAALMQEKKKNIEIQQCIKLIGIVSDELIKTRLIREEEEAASKDNNSASSFHRALVSEILEGFQGFPSVSSQFRPFSCTALVVLGCSWMFC